MTRAGVDFVRLVAEVGAAAVVGVGAADSVHGVRLPVGGRPDANAVPVPDVRWQVDAGDRESGNGDR